MSNKEKGKKIKIKIFSSEQRFKCSYSQKNNFNAFAFP